MSNLNEQIINTVNNHINDVCKDYKETTVLLESLPVVIGLKKKNYRIRKRGISFKTSIIN